MSPEVSMMQLTHFLQLHISGKFQRFDYNDKNYLHYNSLDPPEYDLERVTAPMNLYSASEDLLVAPKDVEYLKEKLPNVQCCQMIHDWNHMDVMLGRNSRKNLYQNILRSMNYAG